MHWAEAPECTGGEGGHGRPHLMLAPGSAFPPAGAGRPVTWLYPRALHVLAGCSHRAPVWGASFDWHCVQWWNLSSGPPSRSLEVLVVGQVLWGLGQLLNT